MESNKTYQAPLPTILRGFEINCILGIKTNRKILTANLVSGTFAQTTVGESLLEITNKKVFSRAPNKNNTFLSCIFKIWSSTVSAITTR